MNLTKTIFQKNEKCKQNLNKLHRKLRLLSITHIRLHLRLL